MPNPEQLSAEPADNEYELIVNPERCNDRGIPAEWSTFKLERIRRILGYADDDPVYLQYKREIAEGEASAE